jgi:hypothetical protein
MQTEAPIDFFSNFMFHQKYKLIDPIGLAVMLICGPASVAFSSDTSADIESPYQIFQKVQDNYVSLSSYSDEGQIITAVDGTTDTAAEFNIRLARPGFYQIEWSQYGGSSYAAEDAGIRAVWSSGAGDYVDLRWGVQKQYNRDVALAKAEAASGSAAVTIPQMFFDTQWQDQRDDSILDEKRLADEKVGRVDCYVLVRELQNGETKTFWVGKQDFLIREIRTEISVKAIQQAWAGAAGRPAMIANFQGISSIETHTNIVVNKAFSREDFIPSFPLYQKSN